MSNVKRFPDRDFEPPSRSISPRSTNSSDGAATTLCGSNTRCSTSGSSGPAAISGEWNLNHPPEPPASLAQSVLAPDYTSKAIDISARVSQAAEQSTVLALLREGTRSLGAEHAVFISFVRESSQVSACRFMLSCDLDWCRRYLEAGLVADDPWLSYAAQHSEPIVASSLVATKPAQQHAIDLARSSGFASAVILPAHSGAGHSRISALVLGSSTSGFFESEGFELFRVASRVLALELHDWWLARTRRELIARARITPIELELLRLQYQGHSSKRMSIELRVSKCSIDSHFQRMNIKLGVANRKMAVHLALESGIRLG